MFAFHLWFLLLLCFPGALHAQDCDAPVLGSGFFGPQSPPFVHGSGVSYACDGGHKPAAEHWWATTTCRNGTWVPKPQCIDKIRIRCHKGYQTADRRVSAVCENGTWMLFPLAERSDACSEPPKIDHGVVVDQGFEDFFAADSVVRYQCRDGYTVDGVHNQKSIVCIAGHRSFPRVCVCVGVIFLWFLSVNVCGAYPQVPNGVVVEETRMFLKYQCSNYYTLDNSAPVRCLNTGRWSHQPTCKEAFCVLDPAQHADLLLPGVEFLHEGEQRFFQCVWYFYSSYVRCQNGRISLTECCLDASHYYGSCRVI
ncbi:complement factor H-like [Brachionichthys hirsutus]|uniref:complement factor H-like n=1 Tax=Brachionichthys hirsutus TaxID=412623 RepID=UPI003604E183